MAGRSKKTSREGTISKTLKFIIKADKKQTAILEKLTARHSFAIQRYLEILESIAREKLSVTKEGIAKELDQLTIKTADRPMVQFDLKHETKLGAAFLQQCRDAALWMESSFESLYRDWERRRDSASRTIVKILANIEWNEEGGLLKNGLELEEAMEIFSKTSFWRRLKKNEPSPPLQSQQHRPKKLPIQLDSRNLKFIKEAGQFFIRIATLKPYQRLTLALEHGDYHLRELAHGEIIGGKIVKNRANKRWEFHASLRKIIPKMAVVAAKKKNRKQAIIGVDLGIAVDASVVVLVEEEGLKQERFFFLKEPELRKKKFTLEQRKRKLQRIASARTGKERKKAIRELKALGKKYELLTNEACHRIARRGALLAQKYLLEDAYEVHVAISQLRGLRNRARKGDGKGRKYRGKISRFPYQKLTSYIKYKCQEVGVPKTNIAEVKESWTSKTCHKCGSMNTKRPTQASFECLACGCNYHADANAAINIALRYWVKNACNKCQSLKTRRKDEAEIICSDCGQQHSIAENTQANSEVVRMIFLLSSNSSKRKSEGVSKSFRPLLKSHGDAILTRRNSRFYVSPHGTGDSPTCDESAGEEGGGKAAPPDQLQAEEARKSKHFLEI